MMMTEQAKRDWARVREYLGRVFNQVSTALHELGGGIVIGYWTGDRVEILARSPEDEATFRAHLVGRVPIQQPGDALPDVPDTRDRRACRARIDHSAMRAAVIVECMGKGRAELEELVRTGNDVKAETAIAQLVARFGWDPKATRALRGRPLVAAGGGEVT
jgi:hypothetical protein